MNAIVSFRLCKLTDNELKENESVNQESEIHRLKKIIGL